MGHRVALALWFNYLDSIMAGQGGIMDKVGYVRNRKLDNLGKQSAVAS